VLIAGAFALTGLVALAIRASGMESDNEGRLLTKILLGSLTAGGLLLQRFEWARSGDASSGEGGIGKVFGKVALILVFSLAFALIAAILIGMFIDV